MNTIQDIGWEKASSDKYAYRHDKDGRTGGHIKQMLDGTYLVSAWLCDYHHYQTEADAENVLDWSPMGGGQVRPFYYQGQELYRVIHDAKFEDEIGIDLIDQPEEAMRLAQSVLENMCAEILTKLKRPIEAGAAEADLPQ